MSLAKARIAPSALLLIAAFIAVSTPALPAAFLPAVLCHECAHALALRAFHCTIEGFNLTCFGAEMRYTGRLSYAQELLVTVAGPAANLLLAALLGAMGSRCEGLYLFAGVQAVLGMFNLLPVPPLDGSRGLWLLTAWAAGPDAADRVCAAVGMAAAVAVAACTAALCIRTGGGFFLVWAALGLLWCAAAEIGLVKRPQKR